MAVTGVAPVVDAVVAGKRDLDRLRDAVGSVVGSVFYGTMLKAMRESELKGPFGHGGRGEEIFAAQLHGIIAEEMGKATKNGLGDMLYNAMEHQQRLISKLRAKP